MEGIGKLTIELILSITINVCAIAFFAGVLKSTQAHQKELIEIIQKKFDEKIKDLKDVFSEKFTRLELKQDKYNNVITRTFILEEQMKVANNRIEDLEEK